MAAEWRRHDAPNRDKSCSANLADREQCRGGNQRCVLDESTGDGRAAIIPPEIQLKFVHQLSKLA
jgi:hypothetical protein